MPKIVICNLLRNRGLTSRARVCEAPSSVGIAWSTKFFHRSMRASCPVEKCRPASECSKCSQSANTSLPGALQFVDHTAPADFSRYQRIRKIHDIQEWKENRQQHINPRLAGN